MNGFTGSSNAKPSDTYLLVATLSDNPTYSEKHMDLDDLGETTSDIVDDVTSTAESVGGAAFLFRKQLGLGAAPSVDAGVVLDSPKIMADLGSRLSPEAWDKSIQAEFAKKGEAAESAAAPRTVTAAESVGKAEAAGTAAIEAKAVPAAAEMLAAKVSKPVDYLGRIEPELVSREMPKAHEAKHTAHASSEHHDRARTIENPAATKPVAAHSTHVSAHKEPAVSSTPEMHSAKAPHTPTNIEHPHGLASAKSTHSLHPTASAGAHRAEVAVAELAAKESASVALKSALRAVAGPEVALGVAVISAVPDAYHFVDNASGHAISKSAVGQSVARFAEHSGANAAANKVGGLVDSAAESMGRGLANAMAKTGADKALEKASEVFGRAGEASGAFGALAKAGQLWDAGADKLEKVIHDNVHGPDNPSHKATPAAAHAAVPGHPPAAAHAPAVKAAASAVATGPHAADAAKHPASHAEKAAVAPAPAGAHKAPEPPHAPASHSAAARPKPAGHDAGHAAHGTPAHHKPSGHDTGHVAHHGAAKVAPVVAAAAAKSATPTPDLAASETGTSPLIAGNPAKVPSAFLPVDPGTTLIGAAGLSKALEGHMDTHGMGAEAKVLADPMALALAKFLADSPNSSTHLVINPHSDSVAKMTGPTAPAAGDLPSIKSGTLEDVAKSGISAVGVSELREGLPVEAKGKSDLELANVVGVTAISKIAENGLDVQAVDKMHEHIVKSTEGTEFQVSPDRLSTVKALHDMGEKADKDFAVIESNASGTRLIGAMSESEFAAHPGTAGTDLAAVDVSGLRKELSLPESPQAQQQKPEAPAPETALER